MERFERGPFVRGTRETFRLTKVFHVLAVHQHITFFTVWKAMSHWQLKIKSTLDI